MSLRSLRIGLWIAVVALAAIAGTAYFLIRLEPPGSPFGGGDYALVDGAGAPLTETAFRGQPSMVFFGFTHCPDVCPTTLAEMEGWYEALGEDARDLRAYFVTVDPERDTPEVLQSYVRSVSDRVTAVTGSPDEIAKMLTAWAVYAKKVPTEGGEYTMDHTASVYLIDGDGAFQGTIAYGESSDAALQKLRRLVAEG
jgi:protein SCO1/2